MSPFATAALDNDLTTVKQLHRENAIDVRAVDEYGRNSLHLAASQGHLEMTKYLLSVGVSTSTLDSRRRPPLAQAAESGFESGIPLLAAGVNVNALDAAGYTPLLIAVSAGHLGAVRALLALEGVDTSVKGPGGRAAAAVARDRGDDAILALLSRHFSLGSIRQGAAYAYSMELEGPSAKMLPAAAAPLAFRERLASAARHAAAGRQEAAIDILNSVLERSGSGGARASDDERADAHVARGEALLALSQAEAATSDFTQALAILSADPRLSRALMGRSGCALARGTASSSPRLLREAVADAELASRLTSATAAHSTGIGLRGAPLPPQAIALQGLLNSAHAALEAADSSYTRRVEGAEKDAYAVLKVARGAPAEAVKTSYRTLSRACHPDKCGGWMEPRALERAGAKFRRLSEAHSVLTDPTRRAWYDRELNARTTGNTQNG